MSLRVVSFSFLVALASAATLHNPPLDALEAALKKIVNNPHLTAAQLKSAKSVSVSVEKTVAELESAKGQLLSKEAQGAKVTSAIKELQGLEDQLQKAATQVASEKKTDLMKKLANEEEELAKEQKKLKVINLEKKLAEKKLVLEKLVETKNVQAQAGAKQEAQKEAAAQQKMVADVLGVAKNVQSAQGKSSSMTHAAAKVAGGKAAMLKVVLVHLEDRMHNVTATLAKLDSAEKNAAIKSAAFLKAPVNSSSAAVVKAQSMLHMLTKKQHRQFEKTRAPLKSEYKELSEAVVSIRKGDIAGLTKVMAHMQDEIKSTGKSSKFLY